AYYQADVPQIVKSGSTASKDGLYRRVSSLVTSRTVLAHIRKATTGEPSFVNSHPFQYGQWVFAHNGKIGRFDAIKSQIMARIDPSLRANILGETDSEHIFFLILTHMSRRMNLHHKAAHLHDIAAAAQEAIDEIGELTGGMSRCPSSDEDPTFLTFILTDGFNMLAHQGGKELHISTYKKQCSQRVDCPYLSPVCENPSLNGRVNHVIIASEPLQGENIWYPLGFGELIGVDESMRLHQFPRFRNPLHSSLHSRGFKSVASPA
ncbi:MAG: class II glutamine amidotransferase, partial [Pseudobdellovibrionaceae bacterium]|nr:class II glutamine amidotransferase [Pseudobdellovibrionaceae bacterium]